MLWDAAMKLGSLEGPRFLFRRFNPFFKDLEAAANFVNVDADSLYLVPNFLPIDDDIYKNLDVALIVPAASVSKRKPLRIHDSDRSAAARSIGAISRKRCRRHRLALNVGICGINGILSHAG